MTVTLVKCSVPGLKKDYLDLSQAVLELRRHICGICLAGDEDNHPLDFEIGGHKFICHDAAELLSTSCGLEFTLEGDHGLWPSADDIDPNIHRHSRRKHSPAQLISA